MVLATHAIAGAAIGRLTGNAYLSFALGVASHFLLDAVPHWQYGLKSKIYDKDIMAEDMLFNGRFIRDIIFICADIGIGVLVSILAFGGQEGAAGLPAPLVAGLVGGVLPDALQFVFWKFKREPLISLQKFHSWIHAGWDFDRGSKIGFALQIAIIAAIIFVSRAIL